MKTIMFWGHGEWRPTDGHTNVPLHCQLFFFARHNEEINTERMHYIQYAVIQSLEDEADWLENQRFGSMKTDGNLRRIKIAGARIRNYRLMKPSGGVYEPDEEQVPKQLASDCALVTTSATDGETLVELFKRCPGPGVNYLWLPCRADTRENRLANRLIDHENRYQREKEYFKP